MCATSKPLRPGIWTSRNSDVRRQALDDAHRLEAVAGLRDHLDVAHLLEHVAQLFPRELLIVYDDGF